MRPWVCCWWGNNVKEMVLMARADGFRMVVNKNVGFGFGFGFVPDFTSAKIVV
jgi:hypothetical protein